MDVIFAFLQLSGTKVKVVLLKVKCLLIQTVHLTRFWSTGFARSFALRWFALQSLTLSISRTKTILNNWATYSSALFVRQTWFATRILEFRRTVYSQSKRLNTNYKHLSTLRPFWETNLKQSSISFPTLLVKIRQYAGKWCKGQISYFLCSLSKNQEKGSMKIEYLFHIRKELGTSKS